jgi:hypothetical protein
MTKQLKQKIEKKFDDRFLRANVGGQQVFKDRPITTPDTIKQFILEQVKESVIELLPECKKIDIELVDTLHKNIGFNQCREEILNKLKDEL